MGLAPKITIDGLLTHLHQWEQKSWIDTVWSWRFAVGWLLLLLYCNIVVDVIENVSQGGKLSKEGDTEWNMHRQYIVSGGWWDKLADHWMGKLSLLIPCRCLCWTTLLCTCTWFLMPWQSHRHALPCWGGVMWYRGQACTLFAYFDFDYKVWM